MKSSPYVALLRMGNAYRVLPHGKDDWDSYAHTLEKHLVLCLKGRHSTPVLSGVERKDAILHEDLAVLREIQNMMRTLK